MFEIIKFQAWLGALGLNLIMDESKLWAQSLKVEFDFFELSSSLSISDPILLTLFVQYTNTQAVKKWLPFELTCALHLEYTVTIHFVCSYPIYWPYMFSKPRF